MNGKYVGSLEGRKAKIEYDKFMKSSNKERYGNYIAKMILSSPESHVPQDDDLGLVWDEENIINPIWQNGQFALELQKTQIPTEPSLVLYKIVYGISEVKKKQKQTVKLNENTLKVLIAESLKRVLKEGMTTDNPVYDKWYEAKDLLGAEEMLNAIWNYLDSSQIEQIIEWLDQDYELWDEDEEEIDDEENEYPDTEDLNGYVDDYIPGTRN